MPSHLTHQRLQRQELLQLHVDGDDVHITDSPNITGDHPVALAPTPELDVSSSMIASPTPSSPATRHQRLQRKRQYTSNSSKVIQDLRIILDDNKTVFLPGEPVEGILSMHVTEPVQVQHIQMKLGGQVTTSVMPNYWRRQVFSVEILSGVSLRPVFVAQQYVLNQPSPGVDPVDQRGRDPQKPPVWINPGLHAFRFRFLVPNRAIPGSYEGIHGGIQYKVSGYVKTVKRSLRQTVDAEIFIPSTADLRPVEPDSPESVSDAICARSWPHADGRIAATVCIDKKAYSIEDEVKTTIVITNNQKFGILLESLRVRQNVEYIILNEINGPIKDKDFSIPFQKYIPPSTGLTTFQVSFSIPSASRISPTIYSSLVKISHEVILQASAVKPKARIPSHLCDNCSSSSSSSSSDSASNATHNNKLSNSKTTQKAPQPHWLPPLQLLFKMKHNNHQDTIPTFRRKLRVKVPFTITGFPVRDENDTRVSIDTLPLYIKDLVVPAADAPHDNGLVELEQQVQQRQETVNAADADCVPVSISMEVADTENPTTSASVLAQSESGMNEEITSSSSDGVAGPAPRRNKSLLKNVDSAISLRSSF